MPYADVKIMIVDDDPVIRESFGDYFEDQGLRTQLMESGESALAAMDRFSANVVIVDIRLGGMSGEEFIRRAYEPHPCCGFVICTGTPAYRMSESLIGRKRVSSKIFQKPVLDIGALEQEVLLMADRCSSGVVEHADS